MAYTYKRTKAVVEAVALTRAGNWVDAVRRLNTNSPGVRSRDAQILRANMLQALGRAKQAGEAYRALVRRFPRDPIVLMDFADFLAGGRSLRGALLYYRRALRIMDLRRARFDTEDYEEIALAAAEAVEKVEGRQSAIQTLAAALARLPASDELLVALCELKPEAAPAIPSKKSRPASKRERQKKKRTRQKA